MIDDADSISDFSRFEAIIPSPWIPATHAVYHSWKVISELDFAYGFLPKGFTIIAITGTDGKSTTAWLAYNILEKEFSVKKPVYLSGNFDIPFSATVQEILQKQEKRGIIVIEVSSFMAQILTKFAPDMTIVTNLRPDHLNWHTSLREYFEAKMHLVERTKSLVLMNEQVLIFAQERHLDIPKRKTIERFSYDTNPRSRAPNRTDGEYITIAGRKKYALSETHFSGVHNALNILAVGLLSRALRICSKRVRKYLSEIRGLPHRLEYVREKNGIIYIDDSKSTSSQSLEAALTAFDHTHTILIAWWSDKGDTFDGLEKSLAWLKYAVLIGATRESLSVKCEVAWVPWSFASSMKNAVKIARDHGATWDTILLSPWCASFGMFRDYLDRAEQFREAALA